MNPQQLGDSRNLAPYSLNGQKVQLIYKLFLLGNSRKALERELINFTDKAYEEVQRLFSSSCCTNVLSDLAKALDFKCQVVDKVSALLKELTVDFSINLNNEANTSALKPFGNKGSPVTDVLKIGPLLQNSPTKNSEAKTAQVWAALVPIKQQKPALTLLPTRIQLDDTTCRPAPSNHTADATANSALQQDSSQHSTSVVKCTEKVISPPTIIQSPKIVQNEEIHLDPLKEISKHRADRQTALGWASAEDGHVQHQKQTSSQLLQFLKAKGKNTGAPEVKVKRQSKENMTTFSPPAVKHTSFHLEPTTMEHTMEAKASQTLSTNMENQIPVFKVKRVKSSGSLIYSYVTATKTELWDIGDILTETEQANCDVMENKVSKNLEAEVKDPCKDKVQQDRTLQTLQNTDSEQVGNPGPVQARTTNSLLIPEFQFPKFDETEVVVSHIVNPGNFYVQQADSATKLQALVTDSWESSSSYAEQNCIPDIGTKVMGWFAKQEQWCRAQVTKICGMSTETNLSDCCVREMSIQVEVKRLDYGDTACLSLCSIKELTPEMASLPLQAVQVALANVMPVNGSDWSDVSVAWLHTMVHNRIFYGRLYPKGPKVTVELFLERGRLGAMRRGASVSVRLAQNGHAKHSKLRDVALFKKSAADEKRKKQDAEWEKYLISCYSKQEEV